MVFCFVIFFVEWIGFCVYFKRKSYGIVLYLGWGIIEIMMNLGVVVLWFLIWVIRYLIKVEIFVGGFFNKDNLSIIIFVYFVLNDLFFC